VSYTGELLTTTSLTIWQIQRFQPRGSFRLVENGQSTAAVARTELALEKRTS
jgi:hypothetical protein